MGIIVTDRGFRPDDWTHGFIPLSALSDSPEAAIGPLAVEVDTRRFCAWQWRRLLQAMQRIALVRIRLAGFGDATAFELARQLRLAGFMGRIRAHGAVLARQYTLARRVGFCEIELNALQARLQPPEHWQDVALWMPEGLGQTPAFAELPFAANPRGQDGFVPVR